RPRAAMGLGRSAAVSTIRHHGRARTVDRRSFDSPAFRSADVCLGCDDMCDRHTEPSREPMWQVALEAFGGTRGQRAHDDLMDGPAIENITDRESRVLVPDLTGRVDSLVPKALQGLRKCHARVRDRLPFGP